MTPDEIRVEVERWFDQHWSPDLSLIEWRNILVDGGWAAPHWPENCFGRGFSTEQAAVVAAVFEERGAVGAAQSGPRRLAAETILAHGLPDQKQRYLRPILTGEHAWCPALQRAWERLGSGRLDHQSRASGRHLDRQRAEGVEHQRPSRRLRHPVGAKRLGRADDPRYKAFLRKKKLPE